MRVESASPRNRLQQDLEAPDRVKRERRRDVMPRAPGLFQQRSKVVALSVLIVAIIGLSAYLTDRSGPPTQDPSNPSEQVEVVPSEMNLIPPLASDEAHPSKDTDGIPRSNSSAAKGNDVASCGKIDTTTGGQSNEPEKPWLIGPRIGFDDHQLSSWLMPWGDGFLQVGYLQSGEQIQASSNLFAQTSDDGLCWSAPIELDIPREHFEIAEAENDNRKEYDYFYPEDYSSPIVRSDGDRLVIVTHFPEGYLAVQGAMANLAKRAGPPTDGIRQGLLVSTTRDLLNWESSEIPLVPSKVIHESLSVVISAVDAIVTSETLLIQLSELTYSDIRQLVPEYIRDSAKDIFWEDSGSDGLMIRWSIENPESDKIEIYERVIAWADLSPVDGTFFDYLVIGNRPYHYGNRYSTSVIDARWREEPKHHDLPDGLGIEVSIVSTGTGYVAMSDRSLPGYRVGIGGPARLLESSDGVTWSFSDSWDLDVLAQRRHGVAGIPADGIAFGLTSLNNGVIVRSADYDSSNTLPFADYFWPEKVYGMYFPGNDWVDITAIVYPRGKPYAVIENDMGELRIQGRGVIFRTFGLVDPSDETSQFVYLNTVASVDGRNWVSFVEEADIWGSTLYRPWAAAFNGNVAVLVDPDGTSYRYELS